MTVTPEQLDEAFDLGHASAPDDTNPYFYMSPMYFQWEYGRREARIFAPPPAPGDRLAKFFRFTVYVSLLTAAFFVARFALN